MTSLQVRTPVNEAEGPNGFADVVSEALAILDEEQKVFLTGRYQSIPDIAERKLQVLGKLENEFSNLRPSEFVVASVRRIIAASRRNEQLIEAARQGLSHARRRIGAIREAGRGVVAYAEDGSRIASRADLLNTERSF